MPTTIQDLYYGNITPADQTMPADSPLRKLTAQLAKYEAGLTGLLDAEDVPLLKALVDTQQQSVPARQGVTEVTWSSTSFHTSGTLNSPS